MAMMRHEIYSNRKTGLILPVNSSMGTLTRGKDSRWDTMRSLLPKNSGAKKQVSDALSLVGMEHASEIKRQARRLSPWMLALVVAAALLTAVTAVQPEKLEEGVPKEPFMWDSIESPLGRMS